MKESEFVNQYFTDEFLADLPSDNDTALLSLCKKFKQFYQTISSSATSPLQQRGELKGDYAGLNIFALGLEIGGIFEAFFEARGLLTDKACIGFQMETSERGKESSVHEIAPHIDVLEREVMVRSRRDRIKQQKKSLFLPPPVVVYELSDDDLTHIQNLIDELRQTIQKTDEISTDHKRRLLKKLEAMQSELHKRMTDLDRIWAFVIDAQVVGAKYGKTVEKITEDAKEIGKIIAKVVIVAEGIKHGLGVDLTKLLQ